MDRRCRRTGDRCRLCNRRVYAVGFFRHVNGRPRAGIAAFDAATGRLLSWRPVRACLDGFYDAVAASGQRVFVSTSGCVSAVSAATGARLWNASTLGGGLSLSGNRLVVVNGLHVGVLAAATGRRLRWALETGGGAFSGARLGTRVVAGLPYFAAGAFSGARSGSNTAVAGLFHPDGGLTRFGLAALDAATGRPTRWRADEPSGAIGALAVVGNTVYAAGVATGSLRQADDSVGLAAFDATSGQRLPFAPRATFPDCLDQDCTLAATTSAVYIAAQGLETRSREAVETAAFDPRTGSLLPWNPDPQPADGIDALAVAGTNVYLGGDFTTIRGRDRPNLVAVDAVTGAPTTWQPRPDGEVTTLAITNGILYIGGHFTHIGAIARHGVAAFDLSTGALLPWDPGADSNIQWIRTLTASGSTVYVSGNFDRIGGADHLDIAALDATSGTSRAWSPNVDEITSIAATPSKVYIGYRGWNRTSGLATFNTAG